MAVVARETEFIFIIAELGNNTTQQLYFAPTPSSTDFQSKASTTTMNNNFLDRMKKAGKSVVDAGAKTMLKVRRKVTIFGRNGIALVAIDTLALPAFFDNVYLHFFGICNSSDGSMLNLCD